MVKLLYFVCIYIYIYICQQRVCLYDDMQMFEHNEAGKSIVDWLL